LLRRVILARAIMTASNFGLSVASRRAIYAGDFQIQTLFGAQPRSHKIILSADAKLFSDGSSILYSAVPEGVAAPPRTQIA
jgi:hypothetical protein